MDNQQFNPQNNSAPEQRAQQDQSAQPTMSPPTQSSVINNTLGQPNNNSGRRKKLPIIILLVVIVVVVIAGVTFLLGERNKEEPSSNDQSTSSNQQGSTTPEATIASLRSRASSLVSENSSNKTEESDITLDSVTYRVPGYDFLTTVSGDNGFFRNTRVTSSELEEKAVIADSVKLIDYAEKDLGFMNIETIIIEGVDLPSELVILKKDKVVCNISKVSSWINADCTYEDKFISNAEKLKPLVTIIIEDKDIARDTSNQTRYRIFSESKHNGYDKVVVAVNGLPVNLIKGPNKQDWQYVGVLAFQDRADCSRYESNVDVSRAFEGDDCFREDRNPDGSLKNWSDSNNSGKVIAQ